MKKKTAALKNWCILVGHLWCEYSKPTDSYPIILQGNAYGHSVCDDGESVLTSPIVKFDADKKKATTKNTIYTLDGKPEKGFQKFMKDNKLTLKDYEK